MGGAGFARGDHGGDAGGAAVCESSQVLHILQQLLAAQQDSANAQASVAQAVERLATQMDTVVKKLNAHDAATQL